LLSAAFVLALVPRLAGLNRHLTVDEGFWMQRTLAFGAALARGELSDTYRIGHPGVTVMWIGLLGIGPGQLAAFLPDLYSSFPRMETASAYLRAIAGAHYAMAVLTAALTALTVAMAWRLLGRGPGLTGGLLLVLDPYLAGASQLLHVDAALGPLMAVSALAGLLYWTRRRSLLYLALSAVAGGFALLTKAPAVAVAIYFVLVGLIAAPPWRTGWRWGGAVLLWAGMAGAVYFAFWPALWVDPVSHLRRVVEFTLAAGTSPHGTPNFFLGRVLHEDPGPLYYPVALAFRLSPVVLGGLVALLIALRQGQARSAPLLWLLAYPLLFLGVMSLGAKKLDRYVLPAIIVLDLLAGAGIWYLFRELRPFRLAAAAVVVPLTLQLGLLWQAYPYPLAFYNPLFGGPAGARQALMIGLGEGLDQVADYLNSRPDATGLRVATLYDHGLRPLFRGQTFYLYDDRLQALHGRTTRRVTQQVPLDYLVVYVNMVQRSLVPASVEPLLATEPPEFTAFVHGVDYARLYRVSEWFDLPR
jgi:4-amino-4-deoxy-L-arabinose transferase-like glycosyltransferase